MADAGLCVVTDADHLSLGECRFVDLDADMGQGGETFDEGSRGDDGERLRAGHRSAPNLGFEP